MTRYFAYGSNMASSLIRSRCPSAAPCGPALLSGFRLTFRLESQRWGDRAAAITPDPDAAVWGVLWEIEATDLVSLDRAEAAYERREVEVEQAGESGPAITYVLRPERSAAADGLPGPEYAGLMISGAREHGLPEIYIAQLQRRMEAPDS